MMPMLSFENVSVAIADVPVLRNLSFSLQAGASAALIGYARPPLPSRLNVGRYAVFAALISAPEARSCSTRCIRSGR